jgi:hypothetical protein
MKPGGATVPPPARMQGPASQADERPGSRRIQVSPAARGASNDDDRIVAKAVASAELTERMDPVGCERAVIAAPRSVE